jgi:hypothetical protein
MAFQFRCIKPDKPPLTELFVRGISRGNVSPTEKQPPPRTLKSLLEKKLGDIASSPKLWPRFELKFDRECARDSNKREERQALSFQGGAIACDLVDVDVIPESPFTPASKESEVLEHSIHKDSVGQFSCDESLQWSESMATPPVKWETPVTPVGNCSETSESVVDNHCDQTENFTNLAASQKLSVGTPDGDVHDVDGFLFVDTSAKQTKEEMDTAQSMFTNSPDSPVSSHNQHVQETPLDLSEECVDFGNLSTARSLVNSPSPTRGCLTNQSLLEFLGAVPLAESTPLIHVSTGASPVLFDSVLSVTGADDKDMKGTHSMKESWNAVPDVTPRVHKHQAKPRRLSLSKAFAYPTRSQIRHGEEAARPCHRYLTRLARKRKKLLDTDSVEDKSSTLPYHMMLDVSTRPVNDETCDLQMPQHKKTRLEAPSINMNERDYSPNNGLLLNTNMGNSVSHLPMSCVGGLTRRQPTSFNVPGPDEMTKTEAPIDLDGGSTNSKEMIPLAVTETASVCYKTNLHTSVCAVTEAKPLIETEKNNIALDMRTVNDKRTPSVTDRFQTEPGSKVSVSSDLTETSRIPLKSGQRPEHCRGFQTASKKHISVSLASVAMASQLIKRIDVFNALQNSMDLSQDNSAQFVGFQSRFGKPVSVSSSSMARAKQLIENIDHSNEAQKTGMASNYSNPVQLGKFLTGPGRPISVSSRSMGKTKRLMTNIDQSRETDKTGMDSDLTSCSTKSDMGRFQTGSGRRISVSLTSMTKAKRLIASIECNGTNKTDIETTLTSCSTMSDFGDSVQGNDSGRESEGSFQGFQTGAGKGILVSAGSVAKAKRIFKSLHLNDSGIVSGESDQEAQKNKSCIHSDLNGCIKKTSGPKGVAQEDCRVSLEIKQMTGTNSNIISKSMLTVGFQTAAGKPLSLTAESLAKGKQFVQELDGSKEAVSELESKHKGNNESVKSACVENAPVNLTDSEVQELAEACVADEMKSSDVGCLHDGDREPDDLDLSVFTQSTSWEIQESLKALLCSSSQDSDQIITNEMSEKCKLMGGQESNSLVACNHSQNTRDDAIGQMEYKMTEFGESSLSDDLLLTDSIFQDTNEELDTHASHSNSVSKEEMHEQPEKLGKYETLEQLHGEMKHAELGLDSNSLNTALLSESLESVDRPESIVENEYKPPRQDPGDTSKFTPIFMTGLGCAVSVRESAILEAKKRLDLDNSKITVTDTSIPDVQTSLENFQSKQHVVNAFPGLFTAAGKRVEVSDEALAKAKTTLNDTFYYTSNDCQAVSRSNVSSMNSGFLGFQTASGQSVTVSEEALGAVRRQHLPMESPSLIGFQTGSGRNVAFSEDALQQAKRLLSNSHFESSGIAGSQAATVLNNTSPPHLCDNSEAVVPHDVFQTASGASVQISKKSLQETRHQLDNDQIVTYGSKLTNSHLPYSSHQSQIEGSSGKLHSHGPYRQAVSTGALVMSAEHQADFSLCSTLKPPLSSVTGKIRCQRKPDVRLYRYICIIKEMTRDCRTPLGAVGRRPIYTQPGRDFGSSSFKWYQKDILLSRDSPNRSSLFSYPLATPTNEEKNYHEPFWRHRVPNTSPYYPPLEHIEKPRPPRPIPTFRTPYKKDVIKVSMHQGAPLKRDKTPSKAKISMASANSRLNNEPGCRSTINCNMDSGLEEKEKQNTSELQREEKTEVTAVTRDVSPSTVKFGYQTGTVRPLLGLWLKRRLEAPACRRSLWDLSRLQAFQTYSTAELLRLGVRQETLSVSSQTAGDFQFHGEVHFSRAVLTGSHTVRLRDGGQLQLDKSGKGGVKEFIKVMASTPGVDTNLISDEWIYNHYRWIVWKLAAMEVAFPSLLAGRCLTPECVASQLKYRYDREVDRSERSCLKKIYEKDDVASRRMILCVAAIDFEKLEDTLRIIKTKSLNRTRKSTDKDSNISTAEPTSSLVIELTDGWYSIKADFDEPLLSMVKCGKIVTGTKLCIYGAELCALTDACSPLEAPPGVFLRVHANSARRAVWYAKLGYQPCSKAFPVSLSSLYHCGGLVGCVDVVIQRQYPFQVQYVYLLTKSYKIHNNCPCSVDGKDRWKVCVSVNSG